MEKARVSIESFCKKRLWAISLSILLVTAVLPLTARPQTNETDKEQILRQVAREWIDVGTEQYNRGFFKAAEQSFLQARGHQKYLTASEQQRLNQLLEKTNVALAKNKHILQTIRTAGELAEQGQLIVAKAHFENIKDSKFLSKRQRQVIAGQLRKITDKLDEQKNEIAELYRRSVRLYNTGQLEKAREGFRKVAKSPSWATPAGRTAEDYLLKIDYILIRRVRPSVTTGAKPAGKLPKGPGADKPVSQTIKDKLPGAEHKRPEKVRPQIVREQREPQVVGRQKVPEPVTAQRKGIEATGQKRRNILRSYVRAVVNDAVSRAQNYINKGRFNRAKEVILTARRTVNKNHPYLGDELFEQYSSQLEELTEKIIRVQSRRGRY